MVRDIGIKVQVQAEGGLERPVAKALGITKVGSLSAVHRSCCERHGKCSL
jgi:hypothetical protein